MLHVFKNMCFDLFTRVYCLRRGMGLVHLQVVAQHGMMFEGSARASCGDWRMHPKHPS